MTQLGQATTAYAYVANNVANAVDPTGLALSMTTSSSLMPRGKTQPSKKKHQRLSQRGSRGMRSTRPVQAKGDFDLSKKMGHFRDQVISSSNGNFKSQFGPLKISGQFSSASDKVSGQFNHKLLSAGPFKADIEVYGDVNHNRQTHQVTMSGNMSVSAQFNDQSFKASVNTDRNLKLNANLNLLGQSLNLNKTIDLNE